MVRFFDQVCMRITADLIDHSEFHTGLWLQNASTPGWYYFCKGKNSNIVTCRSFIDSVDYPLKDVVSFLHHHGILTTPSCAGHSFSEKKIGKLFDSVQREADDIRGRGIYLKDVQTEKLFSYRDKTYELPWNKPEFVEKLIKYQSKGVLGIRLNKKMNSAVLAKEELKNVKIYVRDNILFFLCDENRHETWKEITRLVKKNVKS